ncbi:hypothetical protein Tco_1283422 [Tanacetum coccineum]
MSKYNPGLETRIWSKDDRRRSKEFMEVIERRLKIRRIFRSLESFSGGSQNLRDLPRDNPLVSVEVLRYDIKRRKKNIRVIPKYHGEDGNPARANIKQALGRYEHVGPQDTRPQDGERSQDDDQRLDLADDLKKAQDHISIERHNPESKLPNFNTRRILVPESQAVNECLKLTEAPTYPESSKESRSKSLTPLPLMKNIQGASTSSETHIREPIWYLDSRCSRSMTGVKIYMHKYVEKLGLKVDNSSCITEGYGSINSDDIIDDKQGTIFNANKEVVLIAPRRNDVYALDMSSLTLNKVLGLPSLVSSKDKPCSTCEKEKHQRASFKTKQNFSIRKCLDLLHMDLFGPVSPMSINHEKYTLVIVDEYSRYPPDEFLYKDEPSRQYQANSNISYYITPHNRLVTKLTKDTHVPKMITPNKQNTPHTKDVGGPTDQINNKGTQEQEVQNELINSQPTKEPSGNNIKTLVSITELSVPDVTRSQITSVAKIGLGGRLIGA